MAGATMAMQLRGTQVLGTPEPAVDRAHATGLAAFWRRSVVAERMSDWSRLVLA